jgi:hypothetical protein
VKSPERAATAINDKPSADLAYTIGGRELTIKVPECRYSRKAVHANVPLFQVRMN